MRRIIIAWALLCLGFFCIGQSSAYWQSRDSNYNTSIVAAGGCSQATALLARMDAAENTAAVTTAVCGMVTDGTYSLLDGLYVYAINSTGNAALNWAKNANNLTVHGSCTFSANNGYTGDTVSCYQDPAFIPSTAGGNWTQNSASIGGCSLSSRAGIQNWTILSAGNGSTIFAAIFNLASPGSFFGELNGAGFPSVSETNGQGSWIVSRTSALNIVGYLNGTSIGTLTDASVGNLPVGIYLMADNNGLADDYTGDQIAYVFFGAGLTGTQATAIYNRMHTYLSTVGAGSGC